MHFILTAFENQNEAITLGIINLSNGTIWDDRDRTQVG